MIIGVDLARWWWVYWIFGIANVIALAAVLTTLISFQREISRRIDIKATPVADGKIAVTFLNHAQPVPPNITYMWTMAVDEEIAADIPSEHVQPGVFAPWGAKVQLGRMPAPIGRFIIVVQSHDQQRFYSKPFRPPRR